MLKDGVDAEGFAVGEDDFDKKTAGDFLRVEELKSL